MKLSSILLATILWAAAPLLAASPLTNPFFAFDNGTGRDQHVPLDEQAELVKRTGYAGLQFTGTQRIPEMLQALESRGLKMFAIYVAAHIDGDKPSYEAGLPEAIKQLQGHGTMIWLTVQGTAPDGDARATAIVREIADMAAASGLRVALYPHFGMYVGSIQDALRVAKNVDRPNVGVSFNLAHFLAAKDEPNLDERLREAMPHLFLVSINGAEHEGGWDRLIQPLDRGEFDVYGFLKKLVMLGYRGPIGLQCYHVPGDREENLTRSMAAWRKFVARMAEEKSGVTLAWAQTAPQPLGQYNPPDAKTNAPPQKSRGPSRAAMIDDTPVRSVFDPGVIPSRQDITPAGIQAVFESKVFGVTFGATSAEIYALTAPRRGLVIFKMDWQTNKVLEQVRSPWTPGKQGIAFDLVTDTPLISATGPERIGGKVVSSVRLISMANGAEKVIGHGIGTTNAGGVAVPAPSPNNSSPRYAIIPLTFDDAAAIVDLSTGELKSSVKTGIAPFGAVINAASTVAYVSNWGGRFPRSGDLTAATGPSKGADLAVVDQRGIAASGTVSRIDIAAGKVTNNIEVGLHPTSLAWDEAHHRLFVSNSNSDTISVIDTAQNKVVETVSVQPFERKVAGVAPEAVVVSHDGRRLYAACGGINAVAVIGVGEGAQGSSKILGLIPTSWYPDHIALSPDGAYLAVSTLLGVGSGWKMANVAGFSKETGMELEAGPTRRYVHSDRGTVQVIPVPDASQLPAFTTAVADNNHMRLRSTGAGFVSAAVKPSMTAAPIPVPVQAGEPSPIQHIFYIIKENRSYDQYFGGIGKGNGDPTLQAYGDEVVPNTRELTRQFVLLDNFYASGGNSGDGHQWVTQASETDYTLWPGYEGRSYPKNGDDPMAFADSGFIWDNAHQAKRTIADFGEFVGGLRKPDITGRVKLLADYKAGGTFQGYFHTTAPIAPLNRFVVKDYPAYGLDVPDVVRARIFLQHLKQWEAAGAMPNLVLVQLPSDHTAGTSPKFSTPKACLADNDLAVGQIVEGISHSQFWRSSLIFVVEDDAQAGLDHVDGHRTVALAVSPYIRRGSIDSTFYSQCSMIKTIEMILGLPPMSLFDLIANDMRNSFQTKPDFTPYLAIQPQQSIYEENPPLASLRGPAREAAIASMHMNFVEPDDVPTEILNAILWHDAKGWNTPVPDVRKIAFTPQ